MTINKFDINSLFHIKSLMHKPMEVIEGGINGNHYRASIAIPNYADNILKQYPGFTKSGLDHVCESVAVPFYYKHFGLFCEFDEQIEIQLHDSEMKLDDNVRVMVDIFGPLFIRNVFMDSEYRKLGHKNRFPHLHFHRDRQSTSPTPYSMFSRDPFDPIQVEPRLSSTLFIPNITAYLQCLEEKRFDDIKDGGVKSHCDLFMQEDIKKYTESIVLEYPWSEPRGTGEIAIIDNRTLLHASYYQNPTMKAYRIGVRYLQ